SLIVILFALAPNSVLAIDTCMAILTKMKPEQIEVKEVGFIHGTTDEDSDLVEYSYSVDGKEIGRSKFNSTRRGLDYHRVFFPPHLKKFLESSFLKGKKILDAATGKGWFVMDLLAQGFNALGLDAFLVPQLRSTKSVVEY